MNVDSGLVRAQMTKRDRHNQSSHELKRSCDILRLRQSTCAQVFQHTLGSSQFVWRCDAGSLSEITDAMLKHFHVESFQSLCTLSEEIDGSAFYIFLVIMSSDLVLDDRVCCLNAKIGRAHV